MYKLAIDCYGGDRSPQANVDGVLLALSKYTDLSFILVGNEEELKAHLKDKTYDSTRIEFLDAKEVITCNDKPTDAIRQKKDSSLVKAIRLVREDDSVAGIVSSGSTGALVAASLLRIGRLEGVIRPAFCPILPTMNGGIVGICDSGANVDITPEHLQQFAILGSAYLECVYHIDHPRVALLNIGTEETKGDELRKNAYQLLKNTKGINFQGNMEARELLEGKYDLVVCDGFSGNILCKATEGACLQMLLRLKKDIFSKLRYKIGALFMKQMFHDEKEFMNYQNYGGSLLLGCSKIVIKGHGSSNAKAFSVCIDQAYQMISQNYFTRAEALLSANQNPES